MSSHEQRVYKAKESSSNEGVPLERLDIPPTMPSSREQDLPFYDSMLEKGEELNDEIKRMAEEGYDWVFLKKADAELKRYLDELKINNEFHRNNSYHNPIASEKFYREMLYWSVKIKTKLEYVRHDATINPEKANEYQKKREEVLLDKFSHDKGYSTFEDFEKDARDKLEILLRKIENLIEREKSLTHKIKRIIMLQGMLDLKTVAATIMTEDNSFLGGFASSVASTTISDATQYMSLDQFRTSKKDFYRNFDETISRIRGNIIHGEKTLL